MTALQNINEAVLLSVEFNSEMSDETGLLLTQPTQSSCLANLLQLVD